MPRNLYILFIVWCFFVNGFSSADAQIRQINARHTGHTGYFTDVSEFRNSLVCVFRTGRTHHSQDGKIAVTRLVDGSDWEWKRVGTLAVPYADLRDPKVTCLADGRLLLIATAVFPKVETETKRQTIGWTSTDGFLWQPLGRVAQPDLWLWSLHQNDFGVYGVSYSVGKMAANPERRTLRLHRLNQNQFSVETEFHHPLLQPQFSPSEAAITTKANGQMITVIRRNDRNGNPLNAVIGTSMPPFRQWNFKEMPVPLEGPALLTLPNQRVVCAARRPRDNRMSVMELLVPNANVRTFAQLNPTGRDFAYPGLVWHNGHLGISHYSDGKIYFTAMKQGVPGN